MGHTWQQSVAKIVKIKGKYCPHCRKASLLQNYPHLAKEWHPTKNVNINIDNVSASSEEIVWWKCSNGHEWQANVFGRVYHNVNCPYCGKESLLEKYPQLIKEWNWERNTVNPADIYTFNKKVWWICEKKHEWEAFINNRIKGRKCPICSNRQLLYGYNDLETQFPLVAKEWHPTKNGDIQPKDVIATTTTKYWWMCSEGHEWKTTVFHRTVRGQGCSKCRTFKK